MVKKGTTVANRLNREKSTDIKYKNLINRTGPLNKKALKDIFTLALIELLDLILFLIFLL